MSASNPKTMQDSLQTNDASCGAKPRIAIVVSHPIQHFCPQYTSLAANDDWDIMVFFASNLGVKSYHDKNFNKTISWSGLDLSGFNHVFLNDHPIPTGPSLDALELDRNLASFDPDVVISSGYAQKLQRRAQDWAHANGKLLYYISDSQLADRPPLYKTIAKRIFLSRRFSKIDRFLSVGNSNEQVYMGMGIPLNRITRMHFSIDLPRYREQYRRRFELREKMRNQLQVSSNEVLVSTVGKLVSWKRQLDLVKAISIADRSLNLKALIIGSGPDLDEAKAIAEEISPNRIIFTGFVDPVELPALFAASDIYAHVAAFEPHSLAISEAIYMGLPLVLSDHCGSYGPNDDLRVGENGFLYPMGDVAKLSSQLSVLARNETLRAEFSESSHTYAVRAQERSHGRFLIDALRADGFRL